MFNLPNSIAPACFRRRTDSASWVGIWFSNTALAAVVLMPAVSILSFTANGIPCSGPRQKPRASSFSISRASESAESAVTVIKALNLGLSRSISDRHARIKSSGDRVFARRSADADSMDRDVLSEDFVDSWSRDKILPENTLERTRFLRESIYRRAVFLTFCIGLLLPFEWLRAAIPRSNEPNHHPASAANE